MAKAKVVTDAQDRFIGIRFDCPGCGYQMIPTDWIPDGMERSPHYPHQWRFNGDLERPTLRNSILTRYGRKGASVCHSFVTDGRIQFLSDCTHTLAGQTVDLPDIDDG